VKKKNHTLLSKIPCYDLEVGGAVRPVPSPERQNLPEILLEELDPDETDRFDLEALMPPPYSVGRIQACIDAARLARRRPSDSIPPTEMPSIVPPPPRQARVVPLGAWAAAVVVAVLAFGATALSRSGHVESKRERNTAAKVTYAFAATSIVPDELPPVIELAASPPPPPRKLKPRFARWFPPKKRVAPVVVHPAPPPIDVSGASALAAAQLERAL
jgi:hypothetical protein